MASLKRVRFEPDNGQGVNVKRSKYAKEEEEEEDEGEDERPGTSKTPKKHTLDSDEEDEADQFEKLDMEKVEGQEEATLEYEGQIKIMPFNMKEDLEEGHFDVDGHFVYDKKEAMIKDAWLDNIEWDKVKSAAGKDWGKLENQEEDAPPADEKDEEKDMRGIYTRLLEILQEKDTIAGTLKKMNGQKGLNAAEERKRRWAAKKAGTAVEEDEVSKRVAEVTALADSLVSHGHMEAYQLAPEQIRQLLADLAAEKPNVSGPGAKKATVDMFAE